MSTAGKQQLEILRKSLGRTCPPREFRHVYSLNPTRARIARLKIIGLLAAAAFFLAAAPRRVMAASRVYRAPQSPDFSLTANDGQTYTPDYLKGNVVLLYFWATWCPYCRKAVPHMNDLANEYANASFTIIGICGSKDTETWHNYIQEHHMRWPQYFDADLSMTHLFQAHGVPNFFLIDKNGFIVYHQAGWDNSTETRLENLIDKTLARPTSSE